MGTRLPAATASLTVRPAAASGIRTFTARSVSGLSTDLLQSLHFFAPVDGFVTNGFEPVEEHYGIDIVAQVDAPIKATLDGRVITTSWTLSTGHVIGIQHENNLVSFYKHNSAITKKVGTFVISLRDKNLRVSKMVSKLPPPHFVFRPVVE